MITRYREYLHFLDKKLEKMFKDQAPFIKCKEGCAYCCKEGEYPMSELEYINIMFCYNALDDETKDKINENIKKLLTNERKKMYECPFLINNRCAVYSARAIICRTFGLISYDKNDKRKMPFCVDLGLNYANVFVRETETINKNPDGDIEPVAYNIEREFLRSNKIEKEFKIFFGDDKALVDWLREEELFSQN